MAPELPSRLPLPVLILVGVAAAVLVLLLAQIVLGFLMWLIRLALILGAFGAIGLAGLYLWRRGDIRGRS